MTSNTNENDVLHVAVHAGGPSPGVDRHEAAGASARATSSGFRSLVTKVTSVAFGMVGLAVIGLVAGAPKSDRVELMAVAPGLGEGWLAGAATDDREPTVPSVTATTAPPAAPSATAPSQGSGVTADGKVILNVANATELTQLPGIGQKRAEKIVELRQQLGRFKKPSDLLRIKGIGPKSLRKMLPHLLLDPPAPGQGGTPSE